MSRKIRNTLVPALLVIQAGLIAYSSATHSPTDLEPAFLASGISHWEFGRFELYRVNPPLVRMIAAIPPIAIGYQSDWTSFYEGAGSRAEFPIGTAFVKANGPKTIRLIACARWACIPFSLLGSFLAYRWATALYGPTSGMVALLLFAFEPNLLAHGELITPDMAATSLGMLAGYTFWLWVKQPNWKHATMAGVALGLAELTKMMWLILFALWPLLWLFWRFTQPRVGAFSAAEIQSSEALPASTLHVTASLQGCPLKLQQPLRGVGQPTLVQLGFILLTGVYLINLGYGFDDTGTQLKHFEFVSRALTGAKKTGDP